MRSKTPLALMEQAVMVLVFALAAALCLQAFAFSARVSKNSEDRAQALLLAQNAAELLKSGGDDALRTAARRMGGQLSEDGWAVLYDGDWNETADGSAAVYRLTCGPVRPGGTDGVAEAAVCVRSEREPDGDPLAELTAAWQEALRHE